MSPVSRSRKPSKKKQNTPTVRPEPEPLVDCDCPSCIGADPDVGELLDDLLLAIAVHHDSADPLGAELIGASVVAFGEFVEGGEEALAQVFAPALEARASAAALALLLAIGAVSGEDDQHVAMAAADRMAAAGLPLPRWANQLVEPAVPDGFWRLADPDEGLSVLVGSFRRAAEAATFVITVDHTNCSAASHIAMMDTDQRDDLLHEIRAGARADGIELDQHPLDPAEFRWRLTTALDARTVHDQEFGPEPLEDDDPDVPPYPLMAVLVRARASILPSAEGPPAEHRHTGVAAPVPPVPLHAEPTPVYQLKVTLRGAKPPIWRRLTVPADFSLAELHTVIQAAFGWDDSHLHSFQTPYGNFGPDVGGLGLLPADQVTLGQVAQVKEQIEYLYDFGDGWELTVAVEAALDPDEATRIPRCVTGRRAGPPEDCGGVYGYAHLLDVLADPSHPDHDDQLDWLGFDEPGQLDPESFDLAQVNAELAGIRWRSTAGNTRTK